MSYDPVFIATTILTDVDAVSVLSDLPPEELQIRLWHIVADIIAIQYRSELDEAPVPDISSLTDAVLPLVVAGLEKPR